MWMSINEKSYSCQKRISQSLSSKAYLKYHIQAEFENFTNDSKAEDTSILLRTCNILFIVAAGSTGISEIAKNKLLGYSGFCIGGAGCIILVLALTFGIVLPFPGQDDVDNNHVQLNHRPFETASVDLNKMYKNCREYQPLSYGSITSHVIHYFKSKAHLKPLFIFLTAI